MDADFVAGSAGTNPDEPHPPPERLAALADEPPTPVEARHLAGCLSCRAEVESYQSLLALARAERDRLSEPLTDWKSLSGVLAHEGLKPPARRATTTPRLGRSLGSRRPPGRRRRGCRAVLGPPEHAGSWHNSNHCRPIKRH